MERGAIAQSSQHEGGDVERTSSVRDSGELMHRLEGALGLLSDIGVGPSPQDIYGWAQTDGFSLLIDLQNEIGTLNRRLSELATASA